MMRADRDAASPRGGAMLLHSADVKRIGDDVLRRRMQRDRARFSGSHGSNGASVAKVVIPAARNRSMASSRSAIVAQCGS